LLNLNSERVEFDVAIDCAFSVDGSTSVGV
jgi:hypothetical protein